MGLATALHNWGLWSVKRILDLSTHDAGQIPSLLMTGPDAARLRIVVIATMHWASTTRLCLAMADGGFEVRALVPNDHALYRMSATTVEHLGRTSAEAMNTITRTVERFAPDLLIPADERAIDFLRTLYKRAIRGHGKDPRGMAELIETSLGTPSAFVFSCQKSLFVSLARKEGLLVPKTEIVGDVQELRELVAKARFPLVIKRDESFGGLGVRVVSDAAEAERAFLELQYTAGRAFAVRQALKRLDVAYLRRLFGAAPAITLQDYIEGRPANRAVVCYRGEVLAGLSVEVLRSNESTGPATVIQVIDSEEMTRAAAHIVRRLGLSGFVGFDFMLETATGRPYLIEMNARPTQICHLALNSTSDMIGALAAALLSTVRRRVTPNITSRTVALFPQERWRDPNSDYLQSAYHDVPWLEPEFIAAYQQPVAPEPLSWLQRTRRRLRNPRQLFARRLPASALPIATGLPGDKSALDSPIHSDSSSDSKETLHV